MSPIKASASSPHPNIVTRPTPPAHGGSPLGRSPRISAVGSPGRGLNDTMGSVVSKTPDLSFSGRIQPHTYLYVQTAGSNLRSGNVHLCTCGGVPPSLRSVMRSQYGVPSRAAVGAGAFIAFICRRAGGAIPVSRAVRRGGAWTRGRPAVGEESPLHCSAGAPHPLQGRECPCLPLCRPLMAVIDAYVCNRTVVADPEPGPGHYLPEAAPIGKPAVVST